MDDLLNALQWPAMVITLVAAWLVGARSARRRTWGFWMFVFSNVLWCIWGASTQSYALIVLQVGLFVLNLRGVRKNEEDSRGGSALYLRVSGLLYRSAFNTWRSTR
ncbi:hypothetical protein PV762_11850 [Mitsuaria sp. CC2]|uniref:hypothetical protein n=1 Tax=Mitsuaria sp. CC2 TaxID=3029186 RepID=UPI003B8B2517